MLPAARYIDCGFRKTRSGPSDVVMIPGRGKKAWTQNAFFTNHAC